MEKQDSLLEGYGSLVGDVVFGRPQYESGEQGVTILQSIVMLARYDMPRGVEVATHLAALAGRALQIPEYVRQDMTGNGSVEDKVFELSDASLKAMRSDKVAETIAEKLPSRKERMLNVQYGVLPKILIDTGEITGSRSDPDWYNRMFHEKTLLDQGLGKRWAFSITMNDFRSPNYDSLLPQRDLFERILEPALQIMESDGSRPRPAFHEVLDAIYASLDFDTYAQLIRIDKAMTDKICCDILDQVFDFREEPDDHAQ